jgi:hypothetical protein
MVAVGRTFRDVLDGREEAEAGSARLAELYPHAPFSNGFLHGIAGSAYRTPDSPAVSAHGPGKAVGLV